MNSPVDAIADIISYLNQRDFAGSHAACGPTYPLHPRHDRVNAHYLHLTLDSCFQPIVSLTDECVIAHEALLRGPSNAASIEQTFAPETLFARCADDNEITYLDRLSRTLHALNFLLQNTPESAGALHLNVHPQHLLAVDNDHGKTFEGILRQCGLAPTRIVLEIAEHRVTPKNRLSDAICAWQSRGYRIAIDNFGRDSTPDQDEFALRLGPDLIKLDRTVLHVGTGQAQRSEALNDRVARARETGVSVVVTGVETALHRTAARQSGADYAQGHYYGKPQPQCAIEDLGELCWEN